MTMPTKVMWVDNNCCLKDSQNVGLYTSYTATLSMKRQAVGAKGLLVAKGWLMEVLFYGLVSDAFSDAANLIADPVCTDEDHQ